MFNQSVCIVEFPQLYNILNEIENLFKFNIINYKKVNDLIKEVKTNNLIHQNSLIVVAKKYNELFSYDKIDKNAILVFDELPLKLEKIIDIINTQLIKKKYNFQSRLNIKNYVLNFNSRIISNLNYELKLTEREIDIILFLNENNKPQSIDILQNKVWGYTFDLETHTVETHIYRLRKKIKDKFNDEKFIISHVEGYTI
tara:strand:+ start:4240 stop:4836 length:597 start_codon:yes stop_codon:yes gene_type:complete